MLPEMVQSVCVAAFLVVDPAAIFSHTTRDGKTRDRGSRAWEPGAGQKTENTRQVFPLIVTRLAPGPSISSGPAVSLERQRTRRRDGCGVPKTVGSNWITLPSVFGLALAWSMQYSRSPVVPDPGAGVGGRVDRVDRRRQQAAVSRLSSARRRRRWGLRVRLQALHGVTIENKAENGRDLSRNMV